MRKRAPSQRPSAIAPRKKISGSVRSVPTAVKKSKPSSGNLHVATPRDARLKWLRRTGLIAPDEIASDEDYVPLDFTTLNGRELGAVHSRYAVRHSHGLYVLAKLAAEAAALNRDIKMDEAKFRVRFKDDFKTKWELDDAMLLNEVMALSYEK